MDRLLAVMAILRSPRGCPWDREQTLRSLKPFLIEEAHEVLDAIDRGDPRQLTEELGDVLLQVIFQAQLCTEKKQFDFYDVANGLAEKLIRRHPHVFGTVAAATPGEVLKNWEAIKRQEKAGAAPRSLIAGIPRSLPALHKAQQVQKKVARVGFDWTRLEDVLAKLDEEVAEVKAAIATRKPQAIRGELGDLLFTVVNLSRFLGHLAEETLDEAIGRFTRRFQAIERQLHARGRLVADCSLEELEAQWQQVKHAERRRRPAHPPRRPAAALRRPSRKRP